MSTRNPRQTRERLLQTAFRELHVHGFQGMRVDEVLRLSDLRKGAFSHHFASKRELAHAVLEERIRPLMETLWLEPLAAMQDPAAELPALLDSLPRRAPPALRQHGCPLNNLAQEMSALDEGLRRSIAALFEEWITALQQALQRGQRLGRIQRGIDARAVAEFLVSALEGCIGLFKVRQSPQQWRACRDQIARYLQGLGPPPS